MGSQTFILNLRVGKAREVYRDGKAWLVAPATSIVADGILNGSKGPGYYPSSETQKSVKDWDGHPITIGHPSVLGNHVSAHDPEYAREVANQTVGVVKDSRWNGKLQHMLWFDAAKTQKVNANVYNRLKAGQPIELSTGLFTDNEEIPGQINGRDYSWVARNYRPDHMAILPDQRGACSIQDGCGVLVNKNLVNNANSEGAVYSRSKTAMKKEALYRLLGQAYDEGVANTANHPITGRFTAAGDLTHAHAQKGHKDRGLIDDDDDDDDDEEAARRGMSADELAENWANNPQNPGKAPKPVEQVKQGSADALDRLGKQATQGNTGIANAASPTPKEDEEAMAKLIAGKEGSQTQPDGRGVSQIDEQDEDDFWGEADDHASQAKPIEGQKKPLRNSFGAAMDPTCHGCSKDAAAASLDHPDAREHAIGAMDASKDGDSKAASQLHAKAAKAHEGMATDARKDKDPEAAMQHDNAAALHRKAASMHAATMNANPEGHNQYSGGGSGGKTSAISDRAKGFSEKALSNDSGISSSDKSEISSRSSEASQHGASGNHTKAAMAHGAAAELHEEASSSAMKRGDSKAEKFHDQAANAHRMASGSHYGGLNNQFVQGQVLSVNSQMLLNAGVDPSDADEEQRAAIMIHLKHPSTKAAQAASTKANKTGSRADHAAASRAHHKAAKDVGEDTKEGKAHLTVATQHAKKTTNNQETRMFNREAAIAKLTANCTCSTDKAAIQNMSESTLRALTGNTEATMGDAGKNERVGDAGDSEDGYHDEDEFEGKVKVKGKAPAMNARQWEASIPNELRHVWNSAKKGAQQYKLGVVRQLVANVSDPARRRAKGDELLKRPIENLEQMLSDLNELQPQTTNNYQAVPSYLGQGGDIAEAVGIVDNIADDDDTMVPPTINWSEQSDINRGRSIKTEQVA